MAFNDKEQQLIRWGVANGKNKQDIETAIINLRAGYQPAAPQPAQPQSTNSREIGTGVLKGAGQIIKDTGDVIQSGLSGVPVVGPLVNTAGDAIQGAAGLTDENLAPDNQTERIASYGTQAAWFLSPFVTSRLASLTAKGAAAGKTAIKEAASVGSESRGMLGRAVDKAKEFITDPKLALAKQNVSPQLENSANRLLGGTKRLDDPLATYESYLAQSKNALTDIKIDPPISRVGENIGNEFRFVVDRRKHAGKVMGEEIKKVGHIQTNILPAVDTFVTDLMQEGLSYDRVAKKVIQTTKQTKMGAEDKAIIEKYATELQKLGSKPTIAELDAFMSRIPNDINVYKSSKNIVGTTNAERIIKKSLATLRTEFTKDPQLANYAKARQLYSELSDFIDEGAAFLGKITQSGDFAKDASLAKSSVQSILNQGKKDWLNKLEELTGYPALDDSVIALQAMKDAGDFRGLSLLDELSKGTPTSASGITQKALDYALAQAGRAVGGTPEEQTRVFLKALKESASKQTSNAAFGAAAGVNPDGDGELDPEAAIIGAALGIFGGGKLKKQELQRFITDLRRRKQGASERVGRQIDRAIEAAQQQMKSLK